MKRTLLAVLASISLLAGATAQSKHIENVVKAKGLGAGVIRKNGELAGYYSFFEVDKVNRKERAYTVALLDNDLNETGTIDMVMPKNSYLLETVFNGSAFLFLFIDKDRMVTMDTYGLDGKKLGHVSYEDETKYESMRLQTMLAGGEDGEVNASVFPIEGTGFIKQSLMKEKKRGYQITAYGNDMKVLWKTASHNDKMAEFLDIVEANNAHVLGTLMEQKNAFDVPDNYILSLWSATDGKQAFKTTMMDKGRKQSVLGAFIDEDKNEVLVVGEYFGPKDNVFTDKSLGLFAERIDMSGKVLQTEYYDWEQKVNKLRPLDEKGKKERILLYLHRVIKNADGSTDIIAEQFKKVASAAGIASAALGGGGGLSEIRIDDMVVIHLDAQLGLTGYKPFEKGRSRFNLGQGSLGMSAMLMGRYLKIIGAFDYAFTITDKSKDRWFCTYIDYSREKDDEGKRIGTYIGTIVQNKGELTVDKYDVKSKARIFRVLPAKPGNVLIWEYFKKEKAIDLRLEKVNF